VERSFDRRRFVAEATRDFVRLELLDRARAVAEALRRFLPADYPKAVAAILGSLAHDSSSARAGAMDGFRYLPFVTFVREYGADAAHFEDSMRAQYELTQRFTAEFSIRAFLERHPARTLARLHEWTEDPSEHVRRLVSEGTRPRLPWASRLSAFQRDPRPVLELLERLKDDPSEYVRRSVANNLNDIGKDHPEVLVDLARRWLRGATPERRALVTHALRFLVKQGHPGALEALGVGAKPEARVSGVATPSTVSIGGRVRLTIRVASGSRRRQSLAVDLAVHYVKADGSTRAKVFKVAVIELAPRGVAELAKTISFAPHTTRRQYPGRHVIDVVLNGDRRRLGAVFVSSDTTEKPSRRSSPRPDKGTGRTRR
jgi:3-methyladenine DNA glycosylase AlkC